MGAAHARPLDSVSLRWASTTIFSTSPSSPPAWIAENSWAAIQSRRRSSRAAASGSGVGGRPGCKVARQVVHAGAERADKRQVAVELAVVETVADHVVVRDLKPD